MENLENISIDNPTWSDLLLSRNEGFLLVAILPFILLILVVFLRVVHLALESQNKIALNYRLEICGVKAVIARRNFYQDLTRINQKMAPLQKIVYASRVGKVVPVLGTAAIISEATALRLLAALSIRRRILTSLYTFRQNFETVCPATNFSRTGCWCRFRPFSVTDLKYKATLYPDVPPLAELIRSSRPNIFSVQCAGWFRSTLETQNIYLKVDPTLTALDLPISYAYPR